MSNPQALPRRTVLGGGAALGLGLPLLGGANSQAVAAPATHARPGGRATRAAVGFLQQVTDAYGSTGPRLVQSYYDGSGLEDVGFIYDNALTRSPCWPPGMLAGPEPSATVCSRCRRPTGGCARRTW